MAIIALSRPTETAKFTVDMLEDASADLCVCDVMILAVDKFVDDIRDYAKPNEGIKPDEYVFRPALHAMTMIDQARDQLQEAKTKIDSCVSAAIGGNLPRWKTDDSTVEWDLALARYQRLQEASDAMPAGTEGEDEAVDEYCKAMDHLIEKVPAPNLAAAITKLELMQRRFEGFDWPEMSGTAFVADLKRLAGRA